MCSAALAPTCPPLPSGVIGLSEVAQKYWFFVLLGIIAAVILFVQARKRSEKFSAFVDRTLLKIPVIGTIIREAIVARFARTLATTFAAGGAPGAGAGLHRRGRRQRGLPQTPPCRSATGFPPASP